MRLVIVMTIIFQNGIIAVPSQPSKPLEQYKEQQLHIQRLETAVQKLMDENENFKRQIDGLMKSKVVLYADIEDKMASQNDKIASQNDKITSQNDKIASHSQQLSTFIGINEKFELRMDEQQHQLKSKIDETAASVAEIKNTPKTVVAFRATCIDKSSTNGYHPVIWKSVEYNIGSAYDASNGQFTCPYDGIYSFYATSATYRDMYQAYRYSSSILIVVNGSKKVHHHVVANLDDFLHSTPHGVFKLQKGDTVHIEMVGNPAESFWKPDSDNTRTYFQGHLIDLL
jgi:hypothetical protein